MGETYTGLDEEAFETADAGFDEWDELRGVPRDYTAVEPDVYPALALCGGDFEV